MLIVVHSDEFGTDTHSPLEILEYGVFHAQYTDYFIQRARVRTCYGSVFWTALSNIRIIDCPPVAEIKCISCRRILRRMATGE